MAALPSGALVLARGVGVHNESLADFWLGRVGDAAGEVELLKGEVSRLRAEQQWLAISRIPRMPAAEGFSWLDGQNGQVSDRQRRGEAPQYPRLLHPVACAAPRAWTCGSRTCSSCSLTAILSLLPSLIFAVLTARTSRPSSTAIGMWRSTASRAALPLRAASPSARPAGERPVLASHDVVSYVWNFHLEFAFVMFVC